MGLRSWLTRVEEVSDYLALRSQIRHNPLANGLVYVINITNDCPLRTGVWVAWSGDTTSSLMEFMSPYFAERTWILDNLSDECPDYNDDPSQFGAFLPSDADVIKCLIQEVGEGDEEVCTKIKEEMSVANECYSELRKHERFRGYESRMDELLQGLEEDFGEIEETDLLAAE